jgi:hypothetical protein
MGAFKAKFGKLVTGRHKKTPVETGVVHQY